MSINSNKKEGVRGEVTQLRRIEDTIWVCFDILDEILRLVKADQEKMEHINLKEKYASLEPDLND